MSERPTDDEMRDAITLVARDIQSRFGEQNGRLSPLDQAVRQMLHAYNRGDIRDSKTNANFIRTASTFYEPTPNAHAAWNTILHYVAIVEEHELPQKGSEWL